MLRLMRYFRPVLEWLEYRLTPATPAPAAPLAEFAPEPVDVGVSDMVFAGGGIDQLAYFSVPPAVTLTGEVATFALSDAAFAGGFSYVDPETDTAATDAVFAMTLGPVGATQFDFLPPPAPRSLPPTPYGACDVLPPALDLPEFADLMPEVEEDAVPDGDAAEHIEELELVEV